MVMWYTMSMFAQWSVSLTSVLGLVASGPETWKKVCGKQFLFYIGFYRCGQHCYLFIAAKDFWEVQDKVAELIKGKILVGHALHYDLKVLAYLFL